MIKRYSGLAAAGLLCLAASLPTATADQLTAEDMARAPAVTSVNMSEEGDFLIGIIADPNDPEKRALASWDISSIDPSKPLLPSYITPNEGRMTMQAATAYKAGKAIVIANQPGSFNLNGCGEGSMVGTTKTWAYRFYLTDKTVAELDDLTERARIRGVSENTRKCLETGTQPNLIDLPLDPEHMIVQQIDSKLRSTFSKINLSSGRSTFLFRDAGELGITQLDPRDGSPLVKQKVEAKGNLEYDFETHLLNHATGEFELEAPLTTTAASRYTVEVAGYDVHTGKYFIGTDKFSDKVGVYLYDSKTDQFDDEVVFAHPDFDASGVILDDTEENWGNILGFTYAGAEPEVYWVDGELAGVQSGLESAFPGQSVTLQEWTKDRSKILFNTSAPQHPPSYYLLLNKSQVVGIGNQRPWVNSDSLGPQSLVYYEARDGLKIPGILTLPPGFKKGDTPPPAVVHPHGGPWARDFAGWDASGWTQFLASRGYAVLQPQYRGSTGWGRELWLAGDAEWGQKMQDDKDDGARWLVEQGYADADKIAIFGYSYGGFAAFAAAVREDGPFACAIAGAGVANLTRISNNWSENRMQRAYQGKTVTGMDPQRNVDKFNIPILIYHGEGDVRVPVFHAEDFYDSVKSSGKAELLILDDMGHQLDKWTPDNIRDSLNAIDRFLVEDCGF